MKRLAIFVEGQTELIFVRRLLIEIAGQKEMAVECREGRGGRCGVRSYSIISADTLDQQKYFALVTDCGTDNRVLSDIREQYTSLSSAGYERVIGMRDVYPVSPGDIGALRSASQALLPQGAVPTSLVFAIMEIEAWFLAEYRHLQLIDTQLTPAFIQSRLGFNPSVDDMESRPHPAADLDDIYRLIGRRYTKKKASVQNAVDLLDYTSLYLQLQLVSLRNLVREIDGFLS